MTKILPIFAAILFSTVCLAQTKVGDVELPNRINANNEVLEINGAGTRVKLWMDMYAMGLYLKQKSEKADEIIGDKSAMAARLEIISGLITAEKMEKATRTGFKKATRGNTQKIKSEIEEFIAVFKEKIEKRDVFEFVYIPNNGTKIYKNGVLKTEIKGYEFKKALFGIWLCDQPADDKLKQKLLGK